MDLEKFLNELIQFNYIVEQLFWNVQEVGKIDGQYLETFFNDMETLIPQWIYFIEQTEIGEVSYLNQVLNDIEYGMKNQDIVYFMDAIYNGIGDLAKQYVEVISEAINE